MWTWTGVSLASSAVLKLSKLYDRLTPAAENEEVVGVEERCCHLDSLFDTVGGRHSYLVVKTKSGRQVRLDYYPESQVIFTSPNYWELIPQETFRRTKTRPGLKLSDVQRVFQKHIWKAVYSPWSHNCQHVVLDTFNEVSGRQETVLRNDFIVSFVNYLPAYMKKKFISLDSEAKAALELDRTVKEMVLQSNDRKETYWKFLKLARYDFITKLRERYSDALLNGDLTGLSQSEKEVYQHFTKFLPSQTRLEAYDEELQAWEKTKDSRS